MNQLFFQNEKITLRKGRANDSETINELIYSSGPEAFDYMFYNKQKALDFIKFEFKTPFHSLFGKSYSWVGENPEGKVISYAINYSKNQYFVMSLGTIVKIILFFKFNSITPLKRLLEMGKIVKPPRENEWFLTCFGVAENCRGQGIGKLMMNQQMQWAKENAYLIYGLDVTEKNPRAQKLYEQMNLKVYKKCISHIPSVPISFRMEFFL